MMMTMKMIKMFLDNDDNNKSDDDDGTDLEVAFPL